METHNSVNRNTDLPKWHIIKVTMNAGGVDYLISSSTIHFSAATRSRRATGGVAYERCFDIATLPDSIVEINETFLLQLSTNDLSVEFLPQNATVEIEDNDGRVSYIVHFLFRPLLVELHICL